MARRRRLLAGLAIGGWIGALAAQLRAIEATDDASRRRWTVRRNQFLLLSSITMNTLVALTAYRYAKRFGGDRESGDDERSPRRIPFVGKSSER